MTQQEFFNRYAYDVETDRIGGGGFGTVYRATDKSLHRKVAIKVSEVKIVGEKVFSLKAEFDAVGGLPVHPNIAHYEKLCQFKTPYGIFDYAVMQYYEDGNLKQLLESRKLTFEQKEKIAEGILDGIAFLHGNKVVHRDLKPANILICREGDDYVPLITDFGLSKGVEEMSKSGFSNSIAGGSPGYMSPEQIKGGIMQLNTDLWSYGVMVCELFSGRRLFQSASQSGGTTEVNEMILHKDISAEIASLPGKWRMVAERCLVRDNRQRAKSAGELRAIIGTGDGPETKIGFQEEPEITLVEEPEQRPKPEPKPQPRPTPRPQPGQKPKPRLTWLWVLLGVLVLGGVVFGVRRGGERKRVAEEQRKADEQRAAADNAFFRNCNDVTDYRSYLSKYPDGLNAELARNKISQHVADSTKKAKAEAEEERQRQIAAENERKARVEAAGFKYKTFTVNGVTFEMVAVRGGTFTMGATSEQGSDAWDSEKPAHSVTLGDYYIGKFEVTQELWEAVMGSNPSYFKGSKNPVESVSWDDCHSFIRKLNQLTGANFRLPTEAEWEYAARGGNKSRGYKYSGSNNINDVAWFWENSGDRTLTGEWDSGRIKNNNCKTHAVGTKSPNELGIYDMSGNVWEWCQDWYGDYSSGSQTNPQGPSSGSNRVRRGGSWRIYAQLCRVSSRLYDTPDYRRYYLGFRLAVSQ